MVMNLAASTWNYSSALKAGLPFSQMMEEIYDQALGIEFWLATLESGQISQYEQQYKGKFPFVSCHTSQANSFSEEILLNEIKLCHRLGAKILVVHPVSLGYTAHTWDYSYKKRYDAVLLSKVGMYAELAARLGLCLALENGPIEVLEEVIDFAVRKNLQESLGICIDTGHASMHAGKDPENVLKHLRTFKEHLVQLHVHDNLGLKDDHLIPGKGCVPWSAVMEILNDIRQSLPFVFELKTVESPADALKESKSFLTQL
jgi:sugar phosphate isomerase/epimerase